MIKEKFPDEITLTGDNINSLECVEEETERDYYIFYY